LADKRKKTLIGEPAVRVDSPAKATGDAKYTSDLVLPRMLHAKVLRSPFAHARIKSIDASRAESLPGVSAIITGKDSRGHRWGVFPYTQDHPLIAIDKVRFVGEEVAAVAAESEDIAAEALRLIKVEYEELKPAFTIEEALAEGAPRIHEEYEHNINIHIDIHVGDVDKAFREADVVVEDEVYSDGETYAMLEPYAVVAWFTNEGFLDIWVPNAGPHVRAKALSNLLMLPLNKVRVRRISVGGAFGGRSEVNPNDFVTCLLTMKTRRPVKLVLTKEETMVATRQVHDMKVWMRTGAKKDGTIIAKDCRAYYNGGAYSSTGPIATSVPFYVYEEAYRLPNVRYNGYRIITNRCARGMYGHHGRAFQMVNAMHTDKIAEKLGLDPMDVRLKNAMHSGESTATGSVISSCGLSESIKTAAQMSGWKEKRGKLPRYRGIGMGSLAVMCGFPMGFRSGSSAFIRMNEAGHITLFTAIVDNGQGNENMAVTLAAEALGIPRDHVNLVNADTEMTGHDPGAYSQTATFVGGNAVVKAARNVREQVLQIAADQLKVKPEDLDIQDAVVFVKDAPEKKIKISAVAKIAMDKGENIIGKGSYFPKISMDREWVANPYGQMAGTYSFNTIVAEVEVDPETGKVSIVDVWSAQDSGRPINPRTIEGQIEGAVSRSGVGAVLESLEWQKGLVLNPNMLDYKIPLSTEQPNVTVKFVITDDPEGPFGAKEGALTCSMNVYKAVNAAIYDAIGVWINHYPITSSRVLNALGEQAK
jgi:CO/xanthine dehydrogenase Mo-binding subunit